MNRLKTNVRAVTACLLVAALTAACTSCGWVKEKQPDLPFDLKFGMSFDEVADILDDRDIDYSWENVAPESISSNLGLPQQLINHAASCLTITYDHTSQDYADEVMKLDFEFLHCPEIIELILEDSDPILISYYYTFNFYFTDEDKLFFLDCTPPGNNMFGQKQCRKMFNYYSDLFGMEPSPTSYKIKIDNQPEEEWENSRYYVNIGPYVDGELYLVYVYIGQQME